MWAGNKANYLRHLPNNDVTSWQSICPPAAVYGWMSVSLDIRPLARSLYTYIMHNFISIHIIYITMPWLGYMKMCIFSYYVECILKAVSASYAPSLHTLANTQGILFSQPSWPIEMLHIRCRERERERDRETEREKNVGLALVWTTVWRGKDRQTPAASPVYLSSAPAARYIYIYIYLYVCLFIFI